MKFLKNYWFLLLPIYITEGLQASDFQMYISGSLNSQFGSNYTNSALQYYDIASSSKIPRYALVNDANFKIKPIFNQENYSYGGEIVLNADTSRNKTGSIYTGYNTHIFIENDFVLLQVGSIHGIYNKFNVNPSQISTAAGGIGGDYIYWINPYLDTTTQSFTSLVFLLKPSLPSAYETYQANHEYAVANKINFIIKDYNGWNFGLSFTPDTEVHGTISQASMVQDYAPSSYDILRIRSKNIISSSAKYTLNFNDTWQGSLAALGEYGRNKDKNRRDIKAYEFSATVSSPFLSLSGAFGSWLKSNTIRNIGLTSSISKSNTQYWAIGGTYQHHNARVGLGYFQSSTPFMDNTLSAFSKDGNKTQNYSFGADYKLTDGLLLYAELNRYILTDNDFGQKYKGYIALLGSKLIF